MHTSRFHTANALSSPHREAEEAEAALHEAERGLDRCASLASKCAAADPGQLAVSADAEQGPAGSVDRRLQAAAAAVARGDVWSGWTHVQARVLCMRQGLRFCVALYSPCNAVSSHGS